MGENISAKTAQISLGGFMRGDILIFDVSPAYPRHFFSIHYKKKSLS
jgi:hypothetical protein